MIDQTPDQSQKLRDQPQKPIVSSPHLVSENAVELSEVEYGLVQSEKQGKEVFYDTTQQGQVLCMAYRDVREACLFDEYAAFDDGNGKLNSASLSQVERLLRLLSGLYDQAARSATSF